VGGKDGICALLTSTTRMNRDSPGAQAATAGFAVIASLVLCAAVGYGLGSLVGLAVPLGLIGLFCGLGVGMALVYARFRRL
jgi:hypothetical protein